MADYLGRLLGSDDFFHFESPSESPKALPGCHRVGHHGKEGEQPKGDPQRVQGFYLSGETEPTSTTGAKLPERCFQTSRTSERTPGAGQGDLRLETMFGSPPEMPIGNQRVGGQHRQVISHFSYLLPRI